MSNIEKHSSSEDNNINSFSHNFQSEDINENIEKKICSMWKNVMSNEKLDDTEDDEIDLKSEIFNHDEEDRPERAANKAVFPNKLGLHSSKVIIPSSDLLGCFSDIRLAKKKFATYQDTPGSGNVSNAFHKYSCNRDTSGNHMFYHPQPAPQMPTQGIPFIRNANPLSVNLTQQSSFPQSLLINYSFQKNIMENKKRFKTSVQSDRNKTLIGYTNRYYNNTINNNSNNINASNITTPQFNTQLDLKPAFFTQLETWISKSKKIDKYIHSQISGSVVAILKNQKGSHLLQNAIYNTQIDIIQQLFQEISPSLVELLTTPFAQYFCFKIYSLLNLPNKLQYLNQISSSFYSWCTNKTSTYIIQNLIENLHTQDEKEIIVASISNKEIQLSLDVYGTHIWEKILQCFPISQISNLRYLLKRNIISLSCDSNALCTIKKLIMVEYANKAEINQIKHILLSNCLLLTQSPYGNYVIQSVLENWNETDCNLFLDVLLKYVVNLSNQKYSSNVIEKCWENFPYFLSNFIHKITIEVDEKPILRLMENSFGNYVWQTAIKKSRNNYLAMIMTSINASIKEWNDKKLINKWNRIIDCYYKDNQIV